MNLKESTVRIRETFILSSCTIKVKLAKAGEEVEVMSIEVKKRGRPPPMGKHMDKHYSYAKLKLKDSNWNRDN